MKYFKYCPLFVFLMVLSSCSGPITEKDNRKTISLTEEEPFKIVLKGAVDSGFEWKLNSELQFVKIESPVTKTVSGGTETYTFNFKTDSDGEDWIELIYTDGETIAKTFEVHIIVGAMGLIEAK
ncbi:MAG: hypothetical protein ACOH2D_07310 [Gelidibacter sp.]